MATKRTRNGKWHYVIKRAGVLPRPVYLSFTDEAEGDEYVRRLEALLARGIVPEVFNKKHEPSNTLRMAVGQYLDTQHVSVEDHDLLKVSLQRLPKTFDLPAVTFQWASRWVTFMKRELNLAPSTIRHHVGALARALDWLAASGDITVNPLRLLPKGYATYTPADGVAVAQVQGRTKTDTERDRRLEPGEEEAIRAVLDGQVPEGRQRALAQSHGDALNLLFDMALESAMRLSEMFTLQVNQIDLAQHTVFLEKTKNGSKRQVPMTSVLHALLDRTITHREPEEILFPWWNGTSDRKHKRQVTAQLSRQYARIFEAAGCRDLHFHDLRHEATSRLFERTKLSDMEIARITGHKNMTMLRRYANLRGSTLSSQMW